MMDLKPDQTPENALIFGIPGNNERAIKRLVTRTDVAIGSLARTFKGTYPAAPTVKLGKTAITGGYEFSWNLSSGHAMKGYNVYRSEILNPSVADLIKFLPQPPARTQNYAMTYQDITAITTPYYWVASVNSGGTESARIIMQGAASPIPRPSSSKSDGGGSGANSGGGMVGNAFDIPW